MAINATWHRKQTMPKRATAVQRLSWHEAHAKHCGCRPFTTAMRTRLRHEIAAKVSASRPRNIGSLIWSLKRQRSWIHFSHMRAWNGE